MTPIYSIAQKHNSKLADITLQVAELLEALAAEDIPEPVKRAAQLNQLARLTVLQAETQAQLVLALADLRAEAQLTLKLVDVRAELLRRAQEEVKRIV